LITQTKVQEIIDTFGYSRKVMTTGRRKLKATLAALLPGYGPAPNEHDVLPLPETESVASFALDSPLVTKRLAEAMQNDPVPQRRIVGETVASRHNGQSEKQAIRRLIRPFAAAPNGEPTYTTGWHESMTLEAVMHDPQVRRSAYAKARRLGLNDDDLEDCIQQGFIRLWQTLADDPWLLVDKGPVWTGIYVAFAGDTKKFLRHNARYRRFDDPDFDWETADERLQLGLPEHRPEHRAEWTSQADERMDISRFMSQMAREYEDDLNKLIALYALMTTVKIKDVAPMLSVAVKQFAGAIGNEVRAELKAAYIEFAGEGAGE
jgi:hypothetical protein